jgi:DNA-binding response OmpR family regulator
MRAKILAIDDEQDQLELLDSLLREEGFDVSTCPNGLEGLEQVEQSRPDLILVDAAMPKMNGFAFCEAIRKNAATARIPIIMLTGLNTQFARLNGLAHGANIFLPKPFLAEELTAKINELLHSSAGAPHA